MDKVAYYVIEQELQLSVLRRPKVIVLTIQ